MRKVRKTCKTETPRVEAPQRRYGLLSEEQLEAERQFNIEEAERNKRAVLEYQRDEGFAEGFTKGFVEEFYEGFSEGEAKVARTVAGRMADAGLDPDLIKQVTGLDMGI